MNRNMWIISVYNDLIIENECPDEAESQLHIPVNNVGTVNIDYLDSLHLHEVKCGHDVLHLLRVYAWLLRVVPDIVDIYLNMYY